jgi:hypothetical protein
MGSSAVVTGVEVAVMDVQWGTIRIHSTSLL